MSSVLPTIPPDNSNRTLTLAQSDNLRLSARKLFSTEC